MRFSHELSYDASPAEVLDMLSDPGFREKVCDAVRVLHREVSVDGSGAGMSVVVDQTQRTRGVPPAAARFVGDQIRIVQHERWSDATTATLDIEIPGKPGTFTGALKLTTDGEGTHESVAGEVAVRIPLLGGKLESLVGDVLHSALDAEQRVGRAWLAGER